MKKQIEDTGIEIKIPGFFPNPYTVMKIFDFHNVVRFSVIY